MPAPDHTPQRRISTNGKHPIAFVVFMSRYAKLSHAVMTMGRNRKGQGQPHDRKSRRQERTVSPVSGILTEVTSR